MPIMSITDVKSWKHLSSRDWMSLEQLSDELWFKIPSKPSFKATDAVEKEEKKEKKETKKKTTKKSKE